MNSFRKTSPNDYNGSNLFDLGGNLISHKDTVIFIISAHYRFLKNVLSESASALYYSPDEHGPLRFMVSRAGGFWPTYQYIGIGIYQYSVSVLNVGYFISVTKRIFILIVTLTY